MESGVDKVNSSFAFCSPVLQHVFIKYSILSKSYNFFRPQGGFGLNNI